MPFRVRCILLSLCLSGIAQATPAHGVWLEIFDDPAFTQRSGTMAPGFKTLYLRLDASQLVPPGYFGLEMRLSGLEGLLVSEINWTVEPAVALGTLEHGINAGWGSCPQQASLMSVTLYALEPPQQREIYATAHSQPSNPNFQIPLVNKCDAPCFCIAQVRAIPYMLNPSTPVRVETVQWSSIKQLLR